MQKVWNSLMMHRVHTFIPYSATFFPTYFRPLLTAATTWFGLPGMLAVRSLMKLSDISWVLLTKPQARHPTSNWILPKIPVWLMFLTKMSSMVQPMSSLSRPTIPMPKGPPSTPFRLCPFRYQPGLQRFWMSMHQHMKLPGMYPTNYRLTSKRKSMPKKFNTGVY